MRRFSPLLIAAVIEVLSSVVAVSRQSAAAQEATPIVETGGQRDVGRTR